MYRCDLMPMGARRAGHEACRAGTLEEEIVRLNCRARKDPIPPHRPLPEDVAGTADERLGSTQLYPVLRLWLPSLIDALDDADPRAGARLLDSVTLLHPVLRG